MNGGILKRGKVTTTANTLGVDSVDASVAQGYFAYCQDTAGKSVVTLAHRESVCIPA